MGKLIATMNMTLDGYCDHTAMMADDEIHQHYAELLRDAGALLYGRITYQLMESYWPSVVNNPTGNNAMDLFAVEMDRASKIVFSRSLHQVAWKNSSLKNEINREEILNLKHQTAKNSYAGSPSLIVALANMGLVDEFQIAVHPIIAGSGLSLFKNIQHSIPLKLYKTKPFSCGAIILYYESQLVETS
ncbi:MAG: dihydrofolate reductase family protein [Saprospiraceae bacterium]|jgi:dihydrofolate reductase